MLCLYKHGLPDDGLFSTDLGFLIVESIFVVDSRKVYLKNYHLTGILLKVC